MLARNPRSHAPGGMPVQTECQILRFVQNGNNGQKVLVFYRGQRCTYQRQDALRCCGASPRCCRSLCVSRAKYPSQAWVDFGMAGSARVNHVRPGGQHQATSALEIAEDPPRLGGPRQPRPIPGRPSLPLSHERFPVCDGGGRHDLAKQGGVVTHPGVEAAGGTHGGLGVA